LSLGNLEGAGAFTVTVPGVAAVVDGLQKNPQTPPTNPTRGVIMAGQAANEVRVSSYELVNIIE